MSSVCHSYVLLCHPYVTKMSLICTRMSSVCHSYVVLPWTFLKEEIPPYYKNAFINPTACFLFKIFLCSSKLINKTKDYVYV